MLIPSVVVVIVVVVAAAVVAVVVVAAAGGDIFLPTGKSLPLRCTTSRAFWPTNC